jgi:putative transmembrane protein Alph_Pro_TM
MSLVPLLALCFLAGGTPPQAPKITPQVIEVGAFYDGANVRVEGVAALRSKVIVTITGSDREERFSRKGRFGPIWANAGKVRISGAPSLFLRFSAEPVRDMLGGDSIARAGLDEASVIAHMHLEPSSGNPGVNAALRSSFLALKREEGVYSFADRGVTMGRSGNDSALYTLEFRWPKKAPPAEYEVRVFEVHDRAIIREGSISLSVVRTGFPAWLAGLAENRASLYGIAAVLIGALAGFGIDFLTTRIFGKKRAAAH